METGHLSEWINERVYFVFSFSQFYSIDYQRPELVDRSSGPIKTLEKP